MITSAIELDEAVQVGNVRIAALVRREFALNKEKRHVRGWFFKEPLVILIDDGLEVRAFHPADAALISLEEVKRQYPEIVETFVRQAK